MKKLIIFALFAAGLQWAAAQNTGYFYENYPPIEANAKRGIIRENQIAYYEIGNPYNMSFIMYNYQIDPSDYTYCDSNPFVIVPVYNKKMTN